jgi:hypothetical protein
LVNAPQSIDLDKKDTQSAPKDKREQEQINRIETEGDELSDTYKGKTSCDKWITPACTKSLNSNSIR